MSTDTDSQTILELNTELASLRSKLESSQQGRAADQLQTEARIAAAAKKASETIIANYEATIEKTYADQVKKHAIAMDEQASLFRAELDDLAKSHKAQLQSLTESYELKLSDSVKLLNEVKNEHSKQLESLRHEFRNEVQQREKILAVANDRRTRLYAARKQLTTLDELISAGCRED